MSAQEFFQDSIRYVPSKVAAKSADLTADYISRMCREGHVLSTWHQGVWYVNEKSLTDVLAARRAKHEELARAQSEALKREREELQAATVQDVPRKTAPQRRRSSRALPIVALSLVAVFILATSVSALPQTAREKIAEQLPFNVSTKLTELSQLPTNAGSQLAASATSFPNQLLHV